jgi:RHS repeat-associated protein
VRLRSDRDDNILLRFVEDDGGARLTNRYLHGPAVDQILADEQYEITDDPYNEEGDVLWALTDNLGSVRDLVSYDAQEEATDIRNHITYDAFGRTIAETVAGTNLIYAYTGREYDAETGNYYYRARYYDPDTGRFLSEDPIGFDAGDANLSRYVGNDPVNHVDPAGLAKGQIVGWIVRRTAGRNIKVATIASHKEAARVFISNATRNTFVEVMIKGGKHHALKVARIIQAQAGMHRVGKVIKGGTHAAGHPLRNAAGELTGKVGQSHIQLALIRNRHVFYATTGALAALAQSSRADAGALRVEAQAIYSDPLPGKSPVTFLTVSAWVGEENAARHIDWINPAELLAVGGDMVRDIERDIRADFIGSTVTVSDDIGNPIRTFTFDKDGVLQTVAFWKTRYNEIERTIAAEEYFLELTQGDSDPILKKMQLELQREEEAKAKQDAFDAMRQREFSEAHIYTDKYGRTIYEPGPCETRRLMEERRARDAAEKLKEQKRCEPMKAVLG